MRRNLNPLAINW